MSNIKETYKIADQEKGYLFEDLAVTKPNGVRYATGEYLIPMHVGRFNSFTHYQFEKPKKTSAHLHGYYSIEVGEDLHEYLGEEYKPVEKTEATPYGFIRDAGEDCNKLMIVESWLDGVRLGKLIKEEKTSIIFFEGELQNLKLPEYKHLKDIYVLVGSVDLVHQNSAGAKGLSNIISGIYDTHIVELQGDLRDSAECNINQMVKAGKSADIIKQINDSTIQRPVGRWASQKDYLVTIDQPIKKRVGDEWISTNIYKPVSVVAVSNEGCCMIRTQKFNGEIIEVPITPYFQSLSTLDVPGADNNHRDRRAISRLLSYVPVSGSNLRTFQDFIGMSLATTDTPISTSRRDFGVSSVEIFPTSLGQASAVVNTIA